MKTKFKDGKELLDYIESLSEFEDQVQIVTRAFRMQLELNDQVDADETLSKRWVDWVSKCCNLPNGFETFMRICKEVEEELEL